MNSVSIRKFEEKDIPNKVRWINDPRNNKFLHYELPLVEENTRIWFAKNKDRTDRFDAVIEYKGIPVGVIGLLGIGGGKAEYYITMGETEYTGKGIAKQASLLLLEYAFDKLELVEVYLYTEIDNIPAQRLFEKCGFTRLEIAKGSANNRGRLVDRYHYSINAADWRDRR